MSYKTFVNGFPLNASELNGFLMSQVVATFASSTARADAITSPAEGQVTYLENDNVFQWWNGSAWTTLVPSEVQYLTGVTSNIQTQLNAKENASYTVSNISANYTIQATDASRLIVSTGSAVTITIANVLTVGQRIDFLQDGTGQITFAAGSGVTLQSKGNNLKIAAQESAASVICIASGQYRLIGDLAA
jgi:hypothetical protein